MENCWSHQPQHHDILKELQKKDVSSLLETSSQRIEDIRMMTMAKIFEELFTPTLNGIAVSILYLPFTLVVLHAGLNDQLRRRKQTKPMIVMPFPK